MVNVQARCFIVSRAPLLGNLPLARAFFLSRSGWVRIHSSIIWSKLQTAEANTAVNFLGFRRVNCSTIFRHVLQAVLEWVDLNFCCGSERIWVSWNYWEWWLGLSSWWWCFRCLWWRLILLTSETPEVEVELVLKMADALRVVVFRLEWVT